MGDIEDASERRRKYTQIRVLVIGRANAGKTTLLKRVCNTMDEPCIFDEENNNLLEPTLEWGPRGDHDIHYPFVFASNPQFIFHDSCGFKSNNNKPLRDVQSFIEERSRSTDVRDKLHAIWFCIAMDRAGPPLGPETRFFNEKCVGNGSIVPVIAIFTKFDDLINQVYDMDKEEEENRELAIELLEEIFRKPLSKYNFPPEADVVLEAIHNNEGDHQIQVKELINQTVDVFNKFALEESFISAQQQNTSKQQWLPKVLNKIKYL